MMNVLAISLVLTTLVTAGIFNPHPQKKTEDVIVKDGHRVVVVEFETGDGTKVSISPQETETYKGKSTSGYASNLKDKLYKKAEEASSVLPNVGQGISTPSLNQEEENFHKPSAKELVCDAFGKCKYKVASAFGKTKDKVSEKAHEAADKAYEVEEAAEAAAGSTLAKVKDTVARGGREASVKASEFKERAKNAVIDASGKMKEKVDEAREWVARESHEALEKASEVKERAKNTVDDSADSMKEKIDEVKEGARGTAENAKEKGKDVIDTTKKIKGDVEKDAWRKMEDAKDSAKQGVERFKEEGKKELKEIVNRGRELFSDVFAYVFSMGTLRPFMRLLHLLGFAVAYGMCIWVTFISSYVLARALPRQHFAMVQSKIYPVYFKTMAYSVGAALIGHLLSQKHRFCTNFPERVQDFNLLASLAMLLVNLLYLEPRATKVMFERLKMEKEEGRGRDIFNVEPSSTGVDSVLDPAGTKTTSQTTTSKPATRDQEKSPKAMKPQMLKASQKLKKLNSYSSFLNVLTLMALSHHLVHLTQLVDAGS